MSRCHVNTRGGYPKSGKHDICLHCTLYTWECNICHTFQYEADFSSSMWQHRHQRGATCGRGSNAVCTACGFEIGATKHRCSQCGKIKIREQVSESMWKNSDRNMVCLECEMEVAKQTCRLCGLRKAREQFSDSMRHHSERDAVYLDRSHPPCMFGDSCKTCPNCRSPACQTKICTKPRQTLHWQELPKTIEDVQNFACGRCKYIRCIGKKKKTDGTGCGKERSMKEQPKARRCKEDFTCHDCRHGV